MKNGFLAFKGEGLGRRHWPEGYLHIKEGCLMGMGQLQGKGTLTEEGGMDPGWRRGHCLGNVGFAGSEGSDWCYPRNSLAKDTKDNGVPFDRLLPECKSSSLGNP